MKRQIGCPPAFIQITERKVILRLGKSRKERITECFIGVCVHHHSPSGPRISRESVKKNILARPIAASVLKRNFYLQFRQWLPVFPLVITTLLCFWNAYFQNLVRMASGGGGGNPEGQLHLRFVPTSLVCGSGSVGSICFRATRIRIRHYFVRIRILSSASKKRKKNLDFYYFVNSFDFLATKTYFLLASCQPLVSQSCQSQWWGSGSLPKCHGSTTLVSTALLLLTAGCTVPYYHVPTTAAYAEVQNSATCGGTLKLAGGRCGRFVYHVLTLHNQVESQPSNDRRDGRLLDGSPLHPQMCQPYLYLGSSTRDIMYRVSPCRLYLYYRCFVLLLPHPVKAIKHHNFTTSTAYREIFFWFFEFKLSSLSTNCRQNLTTRRLREDLQNVVRWVILLVSFQLFC